MDELYNVFCNCCQAMCQNDQGKFFMLRVVNPGVGVAHFQTRVFICDLCLLDEDQPIPYIVTEKGRVESMRQPAKESTNA